MPPPHGALSQSVSLMHIKHLEVCKYLIENVGRYVILTRMIIIAAKISRSDLTFALQTTALRALATFWWIYSGWQLIFYIISKLLSKLANVKRLEKYLKY